MMTRCTVFLICVTTFLLNDDVCHGQKQGFQLPTLNRDPPKPTIPADLASYFQLPDAGARRFVGSYLPGFIPPASFDVIDPLQQQQQALLQQIGAPLGVLTASNGFGSGLSPSTSAAGGGLGSGLSPGAAAGLGGFGAIDNGLNPPPSFQLPGGFSSGLSLRPANRIATADGNETEAKNFSSISGIPNVFPSLPKAPVPQASHSAAAFGGLPSSSSSILPSLPVRPEVPQGGLGPLASLLGGANGGQNLPVLAGSSVQQSTPDLASISILQRLAAASGQQLPSGGGVAPGSPFLPNSGLPAGGALPQSSIGGAFPSAANFYPQQAQGNENLFSQLLRTLGLGGISNNLDLSAVNQALGLSGQQSTQGNGLLSNVLYNALTDGNVQTQESINGTSIIDSKANAALIQNLLTQPSSPFCNPKPLPVDKFDVDAFTGKWYQVLYSPPLSAGPCSMITYQKLADVGQGGPGTVFDTFEYTTEATPYGKPRISSGYGIVRGPGQLIYRTTNSPTDVNVYVLQTGPMNVDGQYEYIVLAVNCNYPLHVFARDPVVYKQKFESEVNSMLEKRGLVTSWSRLLNMVAPVDYNLCTFPPSLFNVRG